MFSFILLAGGNGKRMQNHTPKQFLMLAGKTVIVHTMERIDSIEEISEVIVVCQPQYRSVIQKYKDAFGLNKPYIYADAGTSRQESVLNGLLVSSCDHVLIHEAARPFVKREEFLSLIHFPNDNAIMTAPINYTVIKGRREVEGVLEREELKNVQLPQKFHRQTLLEAHLKARDEGRLFTEDASLLYVMGNISAFFVSGTVYNLKITDPIDLSIGEIIYKEYFMERR